MLVSVVCVGLSVSAASASASVRRACSGTPKAGRAECFVLVRTDKKARTETQVAVHAGVKVRAGRPATAVAPTGYGYGPSALQSAYGLAAAAAANGQTATVAVVDAYNDPNAASDLAAYRSAYGLPACTVANGCFEQLNQNGQTGSPPANSGSSGWATEESLDVDMVSAICPQCKIMLVEANSPQLVDLGTAVNAAVAAGAQYVSNSYGAVESASETGLDTSYYDHPGDVITASAGDHGYGVSYPAASPDVVAVGGTSLVKASNARGWSEKVWGTAGGGDGTGSGCSAFEPKPAWQTDPDCANRIVADVSAVADPNTGVAMYDTYDQRGWLQVGGTSAASPIIASVYALAGIPSSSASPAQTLYERPQDLNDVTSGANGSCAPTSSLCTAEIGYDGPTGMGTPDGLGAFTATATGPTNSTAPTITGTPQDGRTLTANHGTWAPSNGDTYKYQWEVCSPACAPITGANKSTLVLKHAEVGDLVTAEVTATDTDGATTVTAPKEIGPVANPAPPVLKKAPGITGTLAPGYKLTASSGTWGSPDTLTYAYQWALCPGQSDTGCTVVGATKTLKLTSADAGQYVMVTVTAADQEGQSTPDSVFSSTTVS